MRDLVGAVLGVVGDHDAAADQHLERAALDLRARAPAPSSSASERRARVPSAGHQPQQDAARGVALVGAEAGQQPVGVAGQRAADAAQRGERLGADQLAPRRRACPTARRA